MILEGQSPYRPSTDLRRFLVLGGVLLLLSDEASRVQAQEQTNTTSTIQQTNQPTRIRPYVHLRSGEFDTVWGVQDMWGFGAGADLTRHFGMELEFDTYEKDFNPFGSKIGEESLLSLVPQVRLRLPLFKDRVVPYVIAGAGIGWYDFNDPSGGGLGARVDAQGTKLVISGGAGVDLFINETVMFNLEIKYLWLNDIDVSVTDSLGSRSGTFDMADFVGTFGFRAYLDNPPGLMLAEAQDEVPIRLYFGAGWGAGFPTDTEWVDGVSIGNEVSSIGTVGQSVDIALGANFGRHLSVELAADYWEGNINLDHVGGVSGGVSEYAVYTLIPNLRLRWPINSGKFVPYLMTGVGGTYGELNDRFDNGRGVQLSSKGFAPAFNVGGGAEYFFNRNVSLFGQAKWIYSWDRTISVDNRGEEKGDSAWLHFQIGFRLYLLDIGGKK